MPIQTLQERCHLATGSGDISSLYNEVSGYYNSGSIYIIFANKLVSELYKRKRVCFHDYTSGMSYFTGIVTGSTGDSGSFWLMEDGSSYWLMEDGSSKWLIES